MPPIPLDLRLRQLTLDAVAAGTAYLHVRHYAGRELPVQELPEVGSFASGWPRFEAARRPWDEEAPEPSQRLQKPTWVLDGHDFLPDQSLKYSPEMAALCAYVVQSDELSRRFSPALPDGSRSDVLSFTTVWVERMLERAWNLGVLPGAEPYGEGEAPRIARRDEIADRLAHAVGVVQNTMDRAGFDAIYAEAESAVLAPKLPVEYWIPLVLTPLASSQALQLDDRCRIEPLTEDLQLARAVGGKDVLAGSPEVLRDAATHALVITGVPLNNADYASRLFGSAQDDAVDFDAVHLACQALRITTGTHVGYAQVWMRPLGWADGWRADLPVLTLYESRRRYDPKLENYGWLNTQPGTVPNERLAATAQVLDALKTANARAKLASRRLSLAVLREDEDDRTVDLCIGLEALLSDGAGTELTYKMSVRGAAALASRVDAPLPAAEVKALLTKIYAHRSAVVHGNPKVAKTRSIGSRQVADVAEELLRALLIDALQRGWDAAKLDDMILTNLK